MTEAKKEKSLSAKRSHAYSRCSYACAIINATLGKMSCKSIEISVHRARFLHRSLFNFKIIATVGNAFKLEACTYLSRAIRHSEEVVHLAAITTQSRTLRYIREMPGCRFPLLVIAAGRKRFAISWSDYIGVPRNASRIG